MQNWSNTVADCNNPPVTWDHTQIHAETVAFRYRWKGVFPLEQHALKQFQWCDLCMSNINLNDIHRPWAQDMHQLTLCELVSAPVRYWRGCSWCDDLRHRSQGLGLGWLEHHGCLEQKSSHCYISKTAKMSIQFFLFWLNLVISAVDITETYSTATISLMLLPKYHIHKYHFQHNCQHKTKRKKLSTDHQLSIPLNHRSLWFSQQQNTWTKGK